MATPPAAAATTTSETPPASAAAGAAVLDRPGANYVLERKLNSAASVAESRRAREDAKKTLKSDVKLTSAFAKKASNISDDTAAALIKDASEKLYLARYTDEIALALANAPLKIKDVASTATLCSVMHRAYEEFTAPLLREIETQFDSAVKAADGVARRRVLFRWLTELYLLGLLPDGTVWLRSLRALSRAGCPSGPLPDSEPPLPNLACENLQAMVGLVKVHSAALLVSTEDGFPPETVASRALALCRAYYNGALGRIQAERNAVKKLKKRIDEENLKRGDASESLVEALKRRTELVDDLVSGATSMAEPLGLAPPPAEEPDEEDKPDEELAGISLYQGRRGAEQELSPEAWVFGSEEARSFYMDLPDVASVIVPSGTLPPAASQPGNAEETLELSENDNLDEQPEDVVLVPAARPVEELMQRLPDLLSVRAVDAFAMDLCRLYSKSTRERLLQELLLVHWSRAELLPFHARLVAILSTVFPDIGPPLVKRLQGFYFRMLKDKKPGRLESRLRNAKYLGELVKFGLHCPSLNAPPAVAFLAVGQSLEHFHGDNIEALCSLIESCGREMVRTPRTHGEMMRLLDAMQRHRNAKVLGPREALVDNAYFYCIPPEAPSARRRARERPELENYVRYLLLERLNVSDGDPKNLALQARECGRALLCLPWQDRFDECEDAVARAMLACAKRRAACLPAVAQVLSQLANYYPHVAKRVCDDLVEAIELGLDWADPRQNQRRLGQARFLGHLLRCSVVSSSTVFDVLHMIVHRGHERTPGPCKCGAAQASRHHPSVLVASDPPYDGFRIRLACALLEAGCESLVQQQTRQSLVLFIKYLDRYVYAKQYIPIDVEICWIEAMKALERHSIKHGRLRLAGNVTSLAQAEEQVRQLEGRAEAEPSALGTLVEGNEEDEEEEEGAIEEDEREAGNADDDAEEVEADDAAAAAAAAAAVVVVEEDTSEGTSSVSGNDQDESGEDDENDEAKVKPAPKAARSVAVSVTRPVAVPVARTAEDDEFDAEFSKLMKETLDNTGRAHLVGAAAQGDNMTVPLGVLKRPGGTAPVANPGAAQLAFLKRGAKGKVEVKTLEVPAEVSIARSRKKVGDTREEKDQIKQVVLGLVSTAKQREAQG